MIINIINNIISLEPNYRRKQILTAVYQDLITDWGEAKYLPQNLRTKLQKECLLDIKAKLYQSADKQSRKALITLDDNKQVETVLMQGKSGRNSVCVSTQIGCGMNCSFCATGKMGLKRNLKADEMLTQVLFWQRLLGKKDKISHVVFMGMGEPFLNWDNCRQAMKNINSKEIFNIAARKISVSTCGIIPEIIKLHEFPLQINLAVSLHAANDSLRSKLMLINKKYPLKNLMEAVDSYIKITKRKVMFEYIMLKDINDSDNDAYGLAKLMQKPLYFLNIIKYNQTGVFQPSSEKQIKRFMQILEKNHIHVARRHSFGEDINAACGQLAS